MEKACKIDVALDVELYQSLKSLAEKHDCTTDEYAERLIREAYQQHNGRNPLNSQCSSVKRTNVDTAVHLHDSL